MKVGTWGDAHSLHWVQLHWEFGDTWTCAPCFSLSEPWEWIFPRHSRGHAGAGEWESLHPPVAPWSSCSMGTPTWTSCRLS